MATPEMKRPREEEETEREVKKLREGSPAVAELPPATDKPKTFTNLPSNVPPAISKLGLTPQHPILPASLELVAGHKADLSATNGFIGEAEAGIIGYVGGEFDGVRGVIKQRFTDFLVNEINLAGEILHLKEIGKPEEATETEKEKEQEKENKEEEPKEPEPESTDTTLPTELQFPPHADWSEATTVALRPHLSDKTIVALHALLLDGREPKKAQDSGWGSRSTAQQQSMTEEEMAMNTAPVGGTSQGRDRGRGRQNNKPRELDSREVVSQVIASKEARGATHDALRRALNGIFDSTARETPDGQVIVIKWSSRNQRKAKQNSKRARLPPYIHFTLHKTSRETQDCLGHIARMLGVHSRDLTVCGTKDKRAVTVQRVCLKRGNHTLTSVWNSVNGVKNGRRSEEAAVTERGERGTRIGDLEYSTKSLALGMLKGNHFTIVLRNVSSARTEDVDAAMESIRDRGFINFFGMQRFGTSTVPTHVTGLFLLQQKWEEAIDSILSLREGEHPDCVRARLAWLEDKDVGKALEIMPRRAVAERAIWEHWKKGNRIEDRLSALGCIPRNLRTMYVHAYQSYIWNLVASKRVQMSREPMVGDLVFADGGDDDVDERQAESSSSRDVKELTEEDLAKYTLADVILPLPGWNVEYPSGALGDLYKEIMAADGLDPSRMRRDQREYSLPGSYRKVIHKPNNVSWEHIRYTDPDIALAQCDEDALLGFNPPAADGPEGKFRALKISWTLGTSCYATMALREITREETATWNQINLTMENEDQAHKGTA